MEIEAIGGVGKVAFVAGEVMLTVGGRFVSETLIVLAVLVVWAPCPSVATAVMVYVPALMLEERLKGELLRVPSDAPLAKNSTLTVSLDSPALTLAWKV